MSPSPAVPQAKAACFAHAGLDAHLDTGEFDKYKRCVVAGLMGDCAEAACSV